MSVEIKRNMEMEAELAPDGMSLRWTYKQQGSGLPPLLVDLGYSGNFVSGTVTGIDLADSIFIVEFPEPNLFWMGAMEGSPSFDPNQWTFPGFPIPKHQSKPVIGCECGAEKARTTHSDWCPKYVIV